MIIKFYWNYNILLNIDSIDSDEYIEVDLYENFLSASVFDL